MAIRVDRKDSQMWESLGLELFKLRVSRQYDLKKISSEVKLPMYVIDKAERGRYRCIWTLMKLARYYGKKLKIGLVEDL